MERFAGRTALVTGAAGGIGAATAYRLAEEGAAIAVVDVDAERCKSTVGNIEALGRAAKAFGCDVSDAAAVAQLRPCVERELGMVDVLVNNAGIIRDALLVDMTPASWSAVIDVNLTSLFYVCQAFLPGMQERGYGKIVNMSSRASLGNLGQTNYSAAKAGVQGFTATLAMEAGPFGINVNAVAPGYFVTPMTAFIAKSHGMSHEEYQAEVAARTPLRRVGQPEELAAVIAFLASDDASYVNGQTLHVNGGASTSR